jgi:hypothetical protein
VTLQGGVQRLQHDFNQLSDTLRVLAVLSPTCPHCFEGYEMLLAMPPAANCLVLWTAMLAGDSADVAAERGHFDHRCAQYWEDASWPVSTRLRPILGFGPYDLAKSAWDVYLLYPPGIIWTSESPPPPTDWTHNLKEYEPVRLRITAALLTRWTSTATT